jgi:hypothetical protein
MTYFQIEIYCFKRTLTVGKNKDDDGCGSIDNGAASSAMRHLFNVMQGDAANPLRQSPPLSWIVMGRVRVVTFSGKGDYFWRKTRG